MKYKKITKGTFLSRPNRFIADVEIDGKIETVHVKNTGRCRELLIPKSIVYLSVSDNPLRKTKFDLVAVEKTYENNPPLLINMDSQAPNYAVEEWLRAKVTKDDTLIKREYVWGNSRFDFYIETENRKILIEVKGVTLEKDSVALFPDAPTLRGVKHIEELIKAQKQGYETAIIFVIQMKCVKEFRPNDLTHKEFGIALRKAQNLGVKVLAYDCVITPESITIDSPVKVITD